MGRPAFVHIYHNVINNVFTLYSICIRIFILYAVYVEMYIFTHSMNTNTREPELHGGVPAGAGHPPDALQGSPGSTRKQFDLAPKDQDAVSCCKKTPLQHSIF